MKFTVVDAESKITARLSPMIRKTVAILNGLAVGRLITANAVAELLETSYLSFNSNVARFIPPAYATRDQKGVRKLYGHPKTIAAWKAKIQN